MTREELSDALRSFRVRDDAYELTGGHPVEKYTLSEVYSRWFVYYSERGHENGKREFAREEDACDYLLHLILNDPTTRQ